MGEKMKSDIPDWFGDRMRQTLWHIKWVLEQNREPFCFSDNPAERDLHSVVNAGWPVFHESLRHKTDEDKVFYLLLLNAVTENEIDISNPKRVGIQRVFSAYQEQKDNFFNHNDEDAQTENPYIWQRLKARL